MLEEWERRCEGSPRGAGDPRGGSRGPGQGAPLDLSGQEPVRARIVAGIEEMPPICPTSTKILCLVNNIDASPADLLRLIRMDPVLTGRILRLINSPLFGLERAITSVGRAMVILGLNTVKHLVVSTAAFGVLTDPIRGEGSSEGIWSHSLWVAVAARAIARARQCSRDEQELAFLGGLLHELGEVCVLRAVPGVYHQLRRHRQRAQSSSVDDKLEFEYALLGMTHEEVGMELARRWELPEGLGLCMGHHHRPLLTGPHAELVCTVYVANALHHHTEACVTGRLPNGEAISVLGLEPHRILDAISHVAEEVRAAQLFLET